MAKNTASGSALLNLALRLKSKDPTLSLEDAKGQAKDKLKAMAGFDKQRDKLRSKLELGVGGAAKHKVLGWLFGQKLGGGIANMIRSKKGDESNAQKLIDLEKDRESLTGTKTSTYGSTDRSWKIPGEEISGNKYKNIMKKLVSIEASIKQLKSSRTLDPKETAIPTDPHHEDAKAGLQALGFKKHEIEEMLKNAKGSTTEELMKEAMKSKKSEPIPLAQVPAAINVAKSESQEDADKTRKTESAAEAVKADLKEKKGIHATLDEILKKIKNINSDSSEGGIFDDVMQFLLKIWSALALFRSGITAIAEFLEGIGLVEVVAALASVGITVGTVLGITAMASHDYHKASDAADAVLNPRGVKRILGENGYTEAWEIDGKRVEMRDLTPEQKDLNTIATTPDKRGGTYDAAMKRIQASPEKYDFRTPEAKAMPAPAAVTSPTTSPVPVAPAAPEPEMEEVVVSASKRIADASAEKEDMTSTPAAVINNITNNKSAPVQPSSTLSENMVLLTRNMEPSLAGYVASIFNHPVAKIGV